jgi:hypothetical protein
MISHLLVTAAPASDPTGVAVELIDRASERGHRVSAVIALLQMMGYVAVLFSRHHASQVIDEISRGWALAFRSWGADAPGSRVFIVQISYYS